MKLPSEQFKKLCAVVATSIVPLWAMAASGTEEASRTWFFGEPLFWVLFAVAAILLYLIYALGQLLILGTRWRIRDKGRKGMMLLVFFTLGLLPGTLEAQTTAAAKSSIASDPFLPMYILIVLELIIVGYLLYSILVADRYRTKFGRKLDIFSLIWKGERPAAAYESQELSGASTYEGSYDMDRVMPPWLRFLFFATIIFAVVFIPYYFLGYVPAQKKKYEQSIAKAAAEEQEKTKEVMIDENTVVVTQTEAVLASGKEVFTTYCAACHGNAGEGGIGPNFADEYWLHGGSIKDIFATIKHGVPEKGMAAWNEIITPQQISDVANYILSLKGTNPPNQKEPQGELWTGDGGAAPDSSATATDTSAVALLKR